MVGTIVAERALLLPVAGGGRAGSAATTGRAGQGPKCALEQVVDDSREILSGTRTGLGFAGSYQQMSASLSPPGSPPTHPRIRGGPPPHPRHRSIVTRRPDTPSGRRGVGRSPFIPEGLLRRYAQDGPPGTGAWGGAPQIRRAGGWASEPNCFAMGGRLPAARSPAGALSVRRRRSFRRRGARRSGGSRPAGAGTTSVRCRRSRGCRRS